MLRIVHTASFEGRVWLNEPLNTRVQKESRNGGIMDFDWWRSGFMGSLGYLGRLYILASTDLSFRRATRLLGDNWRLGVACCLVPYASPVKKGLSHQLMERPQVRRDAVPCHAARVRAGLPPAGGKPVVTGRRTKSAIQLRAGFGGTKVHSIETKMPHMQEAVNLE